MLKLVHNADMENNIIRKEYGRNKPISKEVANEAIRLYESGMTVPPIGKKLNVGRSAIYIILKQNGIKCRSRGHHRNKILGKEEKIISLYNGGMSFFEIGQRFDINEKSIMMFLRKNGIKSRPTGKHDPSKSANWKGGISKTIEYKRAKCKKFTKLYKETKPLFKLALTLRARIYGCFRALKLGKRGSTPAILGADFSIVLKHIESQFEKGMTWKNHGRKGWHIDHKIPIVSAKNKEELLKLFHYTNLQPLWAEDNHQKHAKLDWKKGEKKYASRQR
jgi:hypothetical protein